MNGRVIKLLFSCAVGLYASFVCFNNIFDYGSNFPFVSMVARMEDTFSKEKNGWRSINSSFWHTVFFVSIVAWELTIALCLWLGSFKMINKLRASVTEFKNAKKYTSFGLSLGVLLWFVEASGALKDTITEATCGFIHEYQIKASGSGLLFFPRPEYTTMYGSSL